MTNATTTQFFDVINVGSFAIYDGPFRSLEAAAAAAMRGAELTAQPLMAVPRPAVWTPDYYANRYAAWARKPPVDTAE